MKLVARGLQVLGAASLLLFLAAIGYVVYAFASNTDSSDKAKKSDVVFVLNLGGIKTDQEFSVVSSYVSERSFTGDHLDHHCIQLSEFSPSVSSKEDWLPVGALKELMLEAVAQAQTNGNANDCFGPSTGPRPERLANVWSATIHGQWVTAYAVILFDPSTKRLLYVSSKT